MLRFKPLRRLAAAVAIIAGVVATTSMSGEPAAASPAGGYVAGAGDPSDDLNDEATLCNGCAYSRSNYAGVWQMILSVDYGRTTDGRDVGGLPGDHIDCSFGPETAAYTANWQRYHGVPATGRLDGPTRAAAASRLSAAEGDGQGGDYLWFPADSDNTLQIHRWGASANYKWDVESAWIPGDWHGASYRYVNFQLCT